MCDKSIVALISNRIRDAYMNAFGPDYIRGLYLYGSYARGDNTDDSDIDYVGIVDGDRLDLQRKIKNVWDTANTLGLEYDVIVSPTVIPSGEYEKYKSSVPYYMNIAKEGMAIE